MPQTEADRKEAARLYQIRYRASEHGRIAIARYNQSDKGRANRWRKNHSAAGKAAAERYRATDAYRESLRSEPKVAYQTAYKNALRAERPEVLRARATVNYEIKKGRLIRPSTCGVCKRHGRVEAHHHLGYAAEHWLHVLWLCPKCHKAAHS